MFDQYEYFKKSITPEKFPEIKTIERVTGLAGLEGAMENIRNISPIMLLVEDDGEGYLNLESGNFDFGYHTFTILDLVKIGDSQDRKRALKTCMDTGLRIFKQMLDESKEWGDSCYGFDRSRIDYQKVGPLANNSWGYMFSYILKNENFHLVPKDEGQ